MELEAENSSQCQHWCSLLSLLCRSTQTVPETTEAHLDEQHKANADKTAEVDVIQQYLIQPDKEIINEMDQYCLSVSLDLNGINAERIAPMMVLLCPSTNPNDPTSIQSPLSPSPATLADVELENLLNDLSQRPQLHQFCIKNFCEEYVELYWLIKQFEESDEQPNQQIEIVQNLFKKYVKAGAEKEINCPKTTRDFIQQELSTTLMTSCPLPSDLLDVLKRQILATMRVDMLPKYRAEFPDASVTDSSTPILDRSSILHPTLKLTGNPYSGVGVNIPGRVITSGAERSWEEICRTEVISRLSKKPLFSNTSLREQQTRNSDDQEAINAMTKLYSECSEEERKYFNCMLTTNLDVGKGGQWVEDQIKELNTHLKEQSVKPFIRTASLIQSPSNGTPFLLRPIDEESLTSFSSSETSSIPEPPSPNFTRASHTRQHSLSVDSLQAAFQSFNSSSSTSTSNSASSSSSAVDDHDDIQLLRLHIYHNPDNGVRDRER